MSLRGICQPGHFDLAQRTLDSVDLVIFSSNRCGTDIGRCDGDKFVGEDGFQPVGAVFNIALSEDHPDAFAGELDNWHIHHNTCAGGTVENANDVNAEVEVTATTATPEECRAGGGFFMPVILTWMMHLYVVLDTGGTFDISFDQPGNYQIFCALHPEMQATVVIH